jgi:D-alanyl-D-alanine carboxypeptidase
VKRKLLTILLLTILLLVTSCSSNEPMQVNDLSARKLETVKKEIPINNTEPNDPVLEQPKGEVSIVTEVEEANGLQVILNPENIMAVVNKVNTLPSDFKPGELVVPDVPFYFEEDLPKKYMRAEAAKALEELFAQASKDEMELVAASGYRSYDRQHAIFSSKASRVGEEAANQVVAFPGQSEHQTGLAMDITSAEMGYKLEEEFGETDEGIWLQENAHLFGFIIRYPKGKESITGYQYEPWHIRYVGKEAAKEIYEKGITLEEFVEVRPVDKKVQ